MRPRLDNNAGSLHCTASAGLTTKLHAPERLRSQRCGCALSLRCKWKDGIQLEVPRRRSTCLNGSKETCPEPEKTTRKVEKKRKHALGAGCSQQQARDGPDRRATERHRPEHPEPLTGPQNIFTDHLPIGIQCQQEKKHWSRPFAQKFPQKPLLTEKTSKGHISKLQLTIQKSNIKERKEMGIPWQSSG